MLVSADEVDAGGKDAIWLCTQHGFYSIVKNNDGFNVRGRVKKDLENLVELAGLDVPVPPPSAHLQMGSAGMPLE